MKKLEGDIVGIANGMDEVFAEVKKMTGHEHHESETSSS